MKWYYSLKISTKLISAFIVVAILAGMVGAVGIVQMNHISTDSDKLWNVYGVATADVGKAAIDFQKLRNLVRDILIYRDDSKLASLKETIKQQNAAIDAEVEKIKQNIQTDAGRQALAALTDNLYKYRAAVDKVLDLAGQNKYDQAVSTFYGEGTNPSNGVSNAIDQLFQLKIDNGNKGTDANIATATQTTVLMIVIVIIACLVAISLGFFVSRIISKPVAELVAVAERIAEGDLNVSININGRDEIGKLAAAFARMSNKINEVITNINDASEQVAVGARQLSIASMTLSQGATEQASSIEELTASIEEISAQTKLNAQNATDAANLAEVAQQNAVQGNERMKQMLKAMEEINESSGNINKIIKVIDEIAFQTNILALNAAVEAARAGQHGKGFAVVAEEVRNLAARSANAAKETTTMIEGSIKKVEGGTKIAHETALALNEIVDGVEKASHLVGDIAIASNEQAIGIAQVTQGITQVSQVVQTNSATSEESAASSEELSSQAELLKEQVKRFKLKHSGRTAANTLEEINPAVLRLLEKMSEKKGTTEKPLVEIYSEVAAASSKNIDLSDTEFGKY